MLKWTSPLVCDGPCGLIVDSAEEGSMVIWGIKVYVNSMEWLLVSETGVRLCAGLAPVSGIPRTDMWLFSVSIYSTFTYPLFGRNVAFFCCQKFPKHFSHSQMINQMILKLPRIEPQVSVICTCLIFVRQDAFVTHCIVMYQSTRCVCAHFDILLVD